MNVSDLRKLLTERSTRPGESLHTVRLAGIYGRARTIRRRRRTGGALAALVIFLASVAVTPHISGLFAGVEAPDAVHQPGPDSMDALPEYQLGRKRVVTASGEFPGQSVSTSYRLDDPDVGLVARCQESELPKGPPIHMEIRLNGRPFANGTCDESVSTMFSLGNRPGQAEAAWRAIGIDIGDTVELTMIVTRAASPLPSEGTFSLGVYERVPVEDYPFPPRPEALAPLDYRGMVWPGLIVDTIEASGSSGTHVHELRAPAGLSIYAIAQTPGKLTILVNGTPILIHESWDYSQAMSESLYLVEGGDEYGLDLAPGDPVSIEVRPERMTGDWLVLLVDTSQQRP